MRPRAKVVTAQDVESSLFYCHVDSADDEDLREALRAEDESQELSENIYAQQSQGLKSVNTTEPTHLFRNPQYDFEGRPKLPPRPVSEVQPMNHFPAGKVAKQQGIQRKPVGSGQTKPQPHKQSARSPSPQKLLDPRPLRSNDYLHEDLVHQTAISGKENINPRRWSEQPPPLPPRQATSLGRSSFENATRQSREQQPNRRPFRAEPKGFSVTLIRRDPASAEQWNVGKISMRFPQQSQLVELGRASSNIDDRGILLEMANPGYNKFVCSDQRSNEAMVNNDQNTTFQTWLHLSQPKPQPQALTSYRNGFRSSIDFRQSSSRQSLPNLQNLTLAQQDSSRPFSFHSPWKGICEFATGVAGRSLKCKHIRNPQYPHDNHKLASTVSELRFNLPSNNLVGPKSARHPPLSVEASSWSSFMPPRTDHRLSSFRDLDPGDQNNHDDWDDLGDRMDLSLGQERAGGGFTGKKAKLGKLIVESEGIQMLDLIVAANMGFWWNVTEE